MSAIAIFGSILAVVMASLLVWIFTIKSKEPIIPIYDTKFRNFMPQYTNSFSRGNITNILFGSKRIGIEFMPTDIDLRKLKLDKHIVVEPQLIWLENNKKIDFAKGELSANENETWGLPPKASDFKSNLKKTPFGKSLMSIVEKANSETEHEEILNNRIESLVRLSKKTTGNEIIDDFSNKVQEIFDDISKLPSREKKSIGGFGGSPES